jgi:hypothetical protein
VPEATATEVVDLAGVVAEAVSAGDPGDVAVVDGPALEDPDGPHAVRPSIMSPAPVHATANVRRRRRQAEPRPSLQPFTVPPVG